MNYTIRPFALKTKVNKQGLIPITIMLTVNRKVTQFRTPYKVKEENWDPIRREFKGPLAGTNNILLRKLIAEIEAKVSEQLMSGVKINPARIKNPPSKSFEKFAQEVRCDQKEINRLKEFSGDVPLTEMDVNFLRRYEQHEKKRGMSQNTRNTTFKYLRRIINQAQAEGLIKVNPFDEYDIPRYIQSDRMYLVEEERTAMLDLLDMPLSGAMRTTLAFFLLGCYSGLRHSDWCRFSPDWVQDGFMKLRAKKNKASVVLPIGPTLARIISLVDGKPATNQKCNVYLKALSGMAGIKKPVTCHTARHSFGYLCASNRLPKSVTAELLGVTIQTVNVYYHLSGMNIIEQAAVLQTL